MHDLPTEATKSLRYTYLSREILQDLCNLLCRSMNPLLVLNFIGKGSLWPNGMVLDWEFNLRD